MPHVLRVDEVADFVAWKAIFDQAATLRKNAGEISHQVLCDAHDKNRVVHFSVWSSLDRARRFFESPERVEIRKQAGVNAPEFIYLDQVAHGVW